MISTIQEFHPDGQPKDRAATGLFGAFLILALGLLIVPGLGEWVSASPAWWTTPLTLIAGLAATVAASVGWMFMVKGYEHRESEIQQLAYTAYLDALSDQVLLNAFEGSGVDRVSRHLIDRALATRGMDLGAPGSCA